MSIHSVSAHWLKVKFDVKVILDTEVFSASSSSDMMRDDLNQIL